MSILPTDGTDNAQVLKLYSHFPIYKCYRKAFVASISRYMEQQFRKLASVYNRVYLITNRK